MSKIQWLYIYNNNMEWMIGLVSFLQPYSSISTMKLSHNIVSFLFCLVSMEGDYYNWMSITATVIGRDKEREVNQF